MVQYQVSSIEMQTKEICSSFNMVNIYNTRTHRIVVNVENSMCFLIHSTIYHIYVIGILTG